MRPGPDAGGLVLGLWWPQAEPSAGLGAAAGGSARRAAQLARGSAWSRNGRPALAWRREERGRDARVPLSS